MLLLPAFIALLQVIISTAQWAAYTSQETTANSCNDGDTRAYGSCSPRFLRCRCNQWISAVCPGTSVFDEQTQLCIFSSECNTVTTPSSVNTVTIPSTTYAYTTPGSTPTAPATIGYPTQAPITAEYPPYAPVTVSYPTQETPRSPGYPTAEPISASYPAPEPVTAGYPTPQPITANYPSAQPISVGYPSEQPATDAYFTAEPVTAAYPSPEPVTAGYTTAGTPATPSDNYSAQQVPAVPSYSSQETPIVSDYTSPVNGNNPAADAPSSYQNNPAVAYGVHVATVLSNPFFVERRRGRHNRYRHKSDDGRRHSAGEEVSMRKLSVRSMPVRVNSRSQYVADAFRAHDSKKLLSSSWDVFPRSRVHKKWSERRRKYDEEDEDFELRAASRIPESFPSTESLLEDAPLTDINDIEGSGISETEVSRTTDVSQTNSELLTRRKRSYSLADESSQSVRCKGVADNSVFSMGFCAQNFVVCKSSQEIMAACPVGDLFDFGVTRCVPASVCGVSNADICATEITTTPAPYTSIPISYSPEATIAFSTSYSTEATTVFHVSYSPEMTTASPASYSLETTTAFPTPYSPETTTAAESSTTSTSYTAPVLTYSTVAPYTHSTQDAYTTYGRVVDEEAVTRASPYPATYASMFPSAETTTSMPYSFFEQTTTTEIPNETEEPVTETTTTLPTTTQAPFMPYGRVVEEQEIVTRLSPPAVIYVSVSSNRSEFCVGRGDSLYRDPQSCSGIIQCHGGEMFQHNGCPSGLVFNERKQQCDYKNQVPECDRSEENPAANHGCKGAQHGAYLPDETDCKIFYRCVWNRLEKMNCPAGTFFNPTLSVCDWPANVKCPATTSADLPKSPY